MMLVTRSVIVPLALLAGACRGDPARGASPVTGQVFELACGGSSTSTSGQAQCIRTDTRTGELVHVDIASLPRSNGPTGAAPGPEGRYKTSCVAVNMAERSDFYCLRLNTESGEILLVNLLKIPNFPSAVK